MGQIFQAMGKRVLYADMGVKRNAKIPLNFGHECIFVIIRAF
jgi:hypothetical protein